jgi:uncharacterized protein (TIGR03067 family)
MITRILLPFAATLLVAAVPTAQDAVKTELDKLQGDWTMVSQEVRGKKAPEENVKQSMLTIKGEQWTRTTKGNAETVKFKIDPSKDLKTIDMTFVGPAGNESRWLGIYKLEGDTLTICRVAAPFERPKEFKTTNDAGFLLVWKRAEK